jgi:hypothetical protein
MKITIPVSCSCGNVFCANGYAGKKFPLVICPKCNTPIYIIDHLSISVAADRLLYRSKTEMEGGDFTLSIICSAIAVECTLTQVFLKWKAIENGRITMQSATAAERDAWEKEYRKNSKFIDSANFVSNALVGKKFDDFVANYITTNKDHPGILIKAGLPKMVSQTKLKYFQKEIFDRRNRIMHWGKVDYQQSDAAPCLSAAIGIINILKLMDRLRCEKMELDWRQSNP